MITQIFFTADISSISVAVIVDSIQLISLLALCIPASACILLMCIFFVRMEKTSPPSSRLIHEVKDLTQFRNIVQDIPLSTILEYGNPIESQIVRQLSAVNSREQISLLEERVIIFLHKHVVFNRLKILYLLKKTEENFLLA